MILRGFKLMLGTGRGLRIFLGTGLAVFGLLGGLVQLYAALWPKNEINQPVIVVLIVCAILASSTFRAWPRHAFGRNFDLPDINVRVMVGDLFDQKGHLVIGFSDAFDTDTTDGEIISPVSVQGQFLHRVYGDDRDRLDRDLEAALKGVDLVAEELSADKRGKLRRYPMGTVATLGSSTQRYFCVAYTYMHNHLIVKSTVDYLWEALNSVWEAAKLYGQRKAVVIPIIGSELARINCLDRESLLKMIILSFVARSRQDEVCKELIVVVHPKDYEKIDMLEVRAFLKTL
ncbi:macro domain-containing protein [Amycolatopsis sp. cg5]|uniref:macro domain-containing protein n=1 Tax=Amycolatopsis sp. cg5 TaxID=3238802 RepID=UPI003523FEC9